MEEKTLVIGNKESGWFDGTIVGLGFFPIAVAFGVIAKEFGMTLIESSFCSLIVFAGASQFAALGVLMHGGSYYEAILVTFLMNLRHFLMAISIMVIHNDKLARLKPILGFMLTDESYTFLSLTRKKMSSLFAFKFQLMTYISWNLGTITGYLLGSALPQRISQSLEIALYAMFVSLATVSVKKEKGNLRIIILAGLIHTILAKLNIFTSSWNLIIAMVIGSILSAYFQRQIIERTT